MGTVVFLDTRGVVAARIELQKKTVYNPIEIISNTDEVAVLYRYLPRRAIFAAEVRLSFM